MSKRQALAHEQLSSEKQELKTSDRSFGFLFTIVFGLLGGYGIWNGSTRGYYFLALAMGFLAVAFVCPRSLAPLNRLWFLVGLLLHKIVNPIVLGMLFYLTIVPMGLLMRLLGKDPLRLKRDDSANTYWIVHDPPGPRPDSIKNQF